MTCWFFVLDRGFWAVIFARTTSMDRYTEPDFLGDVVKLALGIFFGLALIWLVIELRARYEVRQLERETQAALAEAHQLHVVAQRRQRERDQADLERRRLQAQRQQEINDANRRKEAAWRGFYQPAPECLDDVRVSCGNAYMRARQEFERRYAAGEL